MGSHITALPALTWSSPALMLVEPALTLVDTAPIWSTLFPYMRECLGLRRARTDVLEKAFASLEGAAKLRACRPHALGHSDGLGTFAPPPPFLIVWSAVRFELLRKTCGKVKHLSKRVLEASVTQGILYGRFTGYVIWRMRAFTRVLRRCCPPNSCAETNQDGCRPVLTRPMDGCPCGQVAGRPCSRRRRGDQEDCRRIVGHVGAFW